MHQTFGNGRSKKKIQAQGWVGRRGDIKIRTHDHNGALVVEHDSVTRHGVGAGLDDGGDLCIKGIGEADVADEAAVEKCKRAHALCAVDGLVGQHKVHGLDVLLQAADGSEGDDAADADAAKGGHVGTAGHLVGRQLVVQAVARQERHGDVAMLEDLDRR